MMMRQYFMIFAVSAPLVVLALGMIWPPILWIFIVLVPVIGLGVIDSGTNQTNYQTLVSILWTFSLFAGIGAS